MEKTKPDPQPASTDGITVTLPDEKWQSLLEIADGGLSGLDPEYMKDGIDLHTEVERQVVAGGGKEYGS